jgi:hypothetical protein
VRGNQSKCKAMRSAAPTLTADDDVLEVVRQKWRELDPHYTSVIRGVPDDFYGDDPRINIFDEKVGVGEEPRLTIGLFLGNHKWAMQRFSPEQCLGIVGMFLSKPSVLTALGYERDG